ncbi:Outer membrane antigenic lipoprotein B [Actinobacillus equuli]|nr:Outer membrane antigenic lipoprotein B [Actinobacillus equuli]
MKKSFLLLPVAALILTACSSNDPAPVVSAKDSTELSPGVMQPVSGTAPTTYGWQSDIQPASMPSSMGNVPASVPAVSQPVVTNPVITEQPAQPQTATKIVKKTKQWRKSKSKFRDPA